MYKSTGTTLAPTPQQINQKIYMKIPHGHRRLTFALMYDKPAFQNRANYAIEYQQSQKCVYTLVAFDTQKGDNYYTLLLMSEVFFFFFRAPIDILKKNCCSFFARKLVLSQFAQFQSRHSTPNQLPQHYTHQSSCVYLRSSANVCFYDNFKWGIDFKHVEMAFFCLF